MSLVRAAAVVGFCFLWAARLPAGVVINEILYHAPDDLDNLQFIELHNPGDSPVDLGGWKLTRAISFEFPAGTQIEPGGYLVLCKDAALFRKYYGFDAGGVFKGAFSHGGDRVDLVDAKGKKIDSVKFKTRAPWPVAADGLSSSLERICPSAPGDVPENWAPSPLPKGPPKPGGTPGKRNANFAARLPPVISNVTFTPAHTAPGQEIHVEADVRSAATVELRWRTAGTNHESKETAVPMAKSASGKYSATIPGQKAG